MKNSLLLVSVIIVAVAMGITQISKLYDHPPEYNICMVEGGDFIEGECVPRE